MAFLKQIRLVNYCGYRDTTFNFYRDNKVKSFISCFAPNGVGKTSLLDAIRMTANPFQYINKETDLLFRKITFHPNYNPTYAGFVESKGMYIESIFEEKSEEKKVIIENTHEFSGVKLCELNKSSVFFVDADNPMNTSKFQIPKEYSEKFLEIAKYIYDFPVEVPVGDLSEVEEYDSSTDKYITFYTDLIIHKPNGTKVHFKRMSAGEKKIATMIASICDPNVLDNYDIFLIDNFSMHVYFKRHSTMVDKFIEHFPDKQIITTTHSGDVIRHIKNKYQEQELLYDIEEIIANVRQPEIVSCNS